MLILALDTATPSGSIAVLRDELLIGVVATSSSENYSSRMFRHLDFLLRDQNLQISEIELFAVAAGPGSFTGLRVGLAAVKGWAEVYSRPIAAVSGLEAVASEACIGTGLIAPFLDARRSQVYGALYRSLDAGLVRIGDECVMPPTEFLKLTEQEAGREPVRLISPTPELIDAAWRESALALVPVERVSSVLSPAIGRLGLSRARRGQLVDALHLEASYVRTSDAVPLWKDK
ncbi:MAG: tRNA (adenosine(37)-N6)-threonylcarbamoyltransferase complex dimerization subunit type 1 TsaB [Candidatus Acidiferrales bacterium]